MHKLYKLFKVCDAKKIGIHIDYTAGVINLKTPGMVMGKYTIRLLSKAGQYDLDLTAEYIAKEWGWDLDECSVK